MTNHSDGHSFLDWLDRSDCGLREDTTDAVISPKMRAATRAALCSVSPPPPPISPPVRTLWTTISQPFGPPEVKSDELSNGFNMLSETCGSESPPRERAVSATTMGNWHQMEEQVVDLLEQQVAQLAFQVSLSRSRTPASSPPGGAAHELDGEELSPYTRYVSAAEIVQRQQKKLAEEIRAVGDPPATASSEMMDELLQEERMRWRAVEQQNDDLQQQLVDVQAQNQQLVRQLERLQSEHKKSMAGIADSATLQIKGLEQQNAELMRLLSQSEAQSEAARKEAANQAHKQFKALDQEKTKLKRELLQIQKLQLTKQLEDAGRESSQTPESTCTQERLVRGLEDWKDQLKELAEQAVQEQESHRHRLEAENAKLKERLSNADKQLRGFSLLRVAGTS